MPCLFSVGFGASFRPRICQNHWRDPHSLGRVFATPASVLPATLSALAPVGLSRVGGRGRYPCLFLQDAFLVNDYQAAHSPHPAEGLEAETRKDMATWPMLSCLGGWGQGISGARGQGILGVRNSSDASKTQSSAFQLIYSSPLKLPVTPKRQRDRGHPYSQSPWK